LATVEHYFQAQKFAGLPYAEQIRTAQSTKRAKQLGRTRKSPLRGDWEAVKDDVMRRAVLRKFQTHADIRALLLKTCGEGLAENSPGLY